ncbi:hypothetical protein EJB05_39358, partial [Eragrostis curvula]
MAPPPGIVEVRCAGCGETLDVEPGLTEFACPDCGTAQALPPELMPRRPRRALPLPGRGASFAATPSRVSCGGCGTVLSVPHGHGHFACPLCGAELAASPAAAVSVLAPPAAVPIVSSWPAQPSEVRAGPSSQSIHAGQILKPIHSKQKHEQRPRYSVGEESFSSFRADTGTEIPVVGRLQNGPSDPSSHREESHDETINGSISRPGKKKHTFAAGPESFRARKVQEEHPIHAFLASEAQGMPSNSSMHKDKAEGLPDDIAIRQSKQKTGHVIVSSSIELERIKSRVHIDEVQQAGEIPKNVGHADQAQVRLATKATENGKKSSKYSKGNQKRKNKPVVNSSNELPHLRRSKRLVKGSVDLVDSEPIQKLDASLNQSQSEAPRTERTLADPDPTSPVRDRFPHAGSSELDDVDATTPDPLNHAALQADQFRHIQIYSPETRWALPVPNFNSWHEHDDSPESFNGIGQLDRGHEEVLSSPSETENQDMDWQVAQGLAVTRTVGTCTTQASQQKPFRGGNA